MPFPSAADAGWILFYLPTVAGIVLLLRERITRGGGTISLLDAAIGALAISAAGAAVAFGAIVDATGGSSAAIATNLAYPLGDLALVAIMVGGLATTGWRLGRGWTLLLLGFLLFGVARRGHLVRLPGCHRQLQRRRHQCRLGRLLRRGRACNLAAVGRGARARSGLERVHLPRHLRRRRAPRARLRPFPARAPALARARDGLRRSGDRTHVADLPAEPTNAPLEQG